MIERNLVAAALAAIAVFVTTVHLQAMTTRKPPEEPLAGFHRLIGGQWHLDDSYQEFEWGVGRKSVIARSFFAIDGKPVPVSEGMWFWHPGEQTIKGVVTAINMPVEFFDYTTRFEADKMVSELTSYDAAGDASRYVETFEFLDESHYRWTLFTETGEGLQKVMGGTYTRR